MMQGLKAAIQGPVIEKQIKRYYDLLDEKLVYTCYVEKLSNKSKYVNSDKMYSEIMNAYMSQKEKQEDLLCLLYL